MDGGSSAAPLPLTGNLHQFTAGQNFDRLTVAAPYIDLFWADPLGGSANDYDLFVLNGAGTTVTTASTDIQNGAGDPYEEVYRAADYPNNSRVVILKKTGAANRFLHLGTNRARLQISTDGETHGHNAASGGYGVAAVPAYAPFNFAPTDQPGPYPGVFSAANQFEKFSSDGPRRVFFSGDGTPKTSGNFSSTGGLVLQQPVIAAADGQEVTGNGGFPNPFYGTSAAVPTAAAIAGLLKAANPALTQTQIRTALTTTATDNEAAGVDRDSGYGIVNAYNAFQTAGVAGKAFVEFNGYTTAKVGGNGSSPFVTPGDTGTLSINLKNTGLLNATGVTTTLTTTPPGVTVSQASSAYSNLAASGGAANNTTNYSFTLARSMAFDQTLNFALTINYGGGYNASRVLNFSVQAGRQPNTTTLDATAPATSSNFPTTATGTQTARVTRADPASTCGTAKAFPGTTGTGSRRYDSYTMTNTGSSPVCATITLQTDKADTDTLQAIAYLGSFNPASLGTNYLGDTSFSPLPGYAKTMSVTVPAGATIVITVNEAAGSGTGSPYTLQVQGIPSINAPTAASATVSGRVSAGGRSAVKRLR